MMYCEFCGKPVSDYAKYCRHCGEKLEYFKSEQQNRPTEEPMKTPDEEGRNA